MKPRTANLHCYRGQTWTQTIYFYRGDDPVDMTGTTCQAQIRPKANSSVLTAAFTCSVEGAEGKITLALDASTTSGLKPGKYVWDLKTTDSDGNVSYYISGTFEVSGRVTV